MTTLSVIIPVKHGGVVSALGFLRVLDISILHRIEILLAEGAAPSKQRNLAAFQAQGDILYFLDDDSQISGDAVMCCLTAMLDESVAVAGGPSVTPDTDSELQKLFGMALTSLFGSGGMRNRYRAVGEARHTTERELILCNLAFRRSVFIEMGGFDERLYPNEENELLNRISKAGYLLKHIPEMAVHRSQRPTVRAFVRQMFGYGRGRSQQTIVSGVVPVVSFIPLLFVLYLVALPILMVWNVFFALPLCVYFLLTVMCAFQKMCSSRNSYSLRLAGLFPLMHISNGCGLMYGLLSGNPIHKHDETIKITRLKSFGQSTW